MKEEKEKAIESLVENLDELGHNKPRRLFQSLREVTEAYWSDEEEFDEIIENINGLEKCYYKFLAEEEDK